MCERMQMSQLQICVTIDIFSFSSSLSFSIFILYEMSNVPVFAEPEELMDLIRDSNKQPGKDYVIVDVRGDDYVVRIRNGCLVYRILKLLLLQGGHIPGAINVPSNEMYDKANDLITEYKDVPKIYFHCALSQVRGKHFLSLQKHNMYFDTVLFKDLNPHASIARQ